MRTHFRALSFALVFTSIFSVRNALPADAWPPDVPPVAEHVRRLMQDRNYAEAVKAIDQAAVRQRCAAGLPGLSEGAGPVAGKPLRRSGRCVRCDAERVPPTARGFAGHASPRR